MADNVWNCLCRYRIDSAKRIERKYTSAVAIRTALASYPRVGEYHGHLSGEPGDGTSDSADKNLDAAIAFLDAKAPIPLAGESLTKAPDTVKKKANEKRLEALKDKIAAIDNLGALKAVLDKDSPGWESDRHLKHLYDAKREEKKGKAKAVKKW